MIGSTQAGAAVVCVFEWQNGAGCYGCLFSLACPCCRVVVLLAACFFFVANLPCRDSTARRPDWPANPMTGTRSSVDNLGKERAARGPRGSNPLVLAAS